MIAVSTVDTVGGILIAIGAAVWLIVDGIKDRVRSRPPHAAADTAGLPDAQRQARPVEAGTFSPADSACREGVAGAPPTRCRSAGEAIEALTLPGPYSRIGNRR